MEQTLIYKALKGVRGRQPVDLAALEQLMVLFQPNRGRTALDQRNGYQSTARFVGAIACPRRASWYTIGP